MKQLLFRIWAVLIFWSSNAISSGAEWDYSNFPEPSPEEAIYPVGAGGPGSRRIGVNGILSRYYLLDEHNNPAGKWKQSPKQMRQVVPVDKSELDLIFRDDTQERDQLPPLQKVDKEELDEIFGDEDSKEKQTGGSDKAISKEQIVTKVREDSNKQRRAVKRTQQTVERDHAIGAIPVGDDHEMTVSAAALKDLMKQTNNPELLHHLEKALEILESQRVLKTPVEDTEGIRIRHEADGDDEKVPLFVDINNMEDDNDKVNDDMTYKIDDDYSPLSKDVSDKTESNNVEDERKPMIRLIPIDDKSMKTNDDMENVDKRESLEENCNMENFRFKGCGASVGARQINAEDFAAQRLCRRHELCYACGGVQGISNSGCDEIFMRRAIILCSGGVRSDDGGLTSSQDEFPEGATATEAMDDCLFDASVLLRTLRKLHHYNPFAHYNPTCARRCIQTLI